MAETLQKPATRFTQTDRTGWVFTLTAKDIIELLPRRSPEQLSLFTETNRPITGRHMESIERFLTDTPTWAMPSITLAVTPNKITERNGAISVDTDDLKILDGQHRTCFAQKMIFIPDLLCRLVWNCRRVAPLTVVKMVDFSHRTSVSLL